MKISKKYIKNRRKTIRKVMNKPVGGYDMEAYHDLRIAIKKIRALLEMLSEVLKGFKKKKSYKPFRKIFKQAGKVRDLQVEEETLEKYFAKDLLTRYREKLLWQMEEEKKAYFCLVNKKIRKKLEKKMEKILSSSQDVKDKKIRKYLLEKRNEIFEITSSKDARTMPLHKLRKKLKTYHYNLESLEGKGKKDLPHFDKDLIDLLGEWHDRKVILKRLKKTEKSGDIATDEQEELQRVKRKVNLEKEKLLEKIEDMLKQK